VKHFSRHLLVGAITAAPLLVTWFVFDLLLGWLSKLGAPGLAALAATLRPAYPDLARWLLVLIAALGWFASRVIGRKVLDGFESLVQRIPLVAAIYGGTKRVLAAVNDRPGESQRVVLIPFPNRQMKTLGFVTKVLEDEVTGEKVAAVYVPTAPNPTSGYIELVPLAEITPTDWTMDEAMGFVVSGGTTAPDRFRFRADGELPPAPGEKD
jgi:uncharacterized membrane protein